MRGADLSVGIFSSLILHVLIGLFGLGSMLARWENPNILPEFSHGLSSIELNLVALEVPDAEPEVPPDPDAVKVSPTVPEPKKVEEERPKEILLDEGVEQGDPSVTTDVKPAYPLGSRMRGEEGAVTVRVWLDAAGRAKRTEVLESSGYPALDRAGIKALKKARFTAGDGSLAYSTETTVTFRFQLVN